MTPADCAGDAGVVLRVFCENAILGANMLTRWWRSKNIGGRIAPAAIGGLIEARLCSVNAFGALSEPANIRRTPVKVLARLNFFSPPFKRGMVFGK